MSRKITIIIEDFESGEKAQGAIPIQENQTTNPEALAKAVKRINVELNAQTQTNVKIISEVPSVLNS